MSRFATSVSKSLSFCPALTALSKASNTCSPWKSAFASRLLIRTSASLILSSAYFTAFAAFACSSKATFTFPSASTIFACAAATFSADSCDTFSASAFANSRFFWAASTFRSASSFLANASLMFCFDSRSAFFARFWISSALISADRFFCSESLRTRSASFWVSATLTFASFKDWPAEKLAIRAVKSVTAKTPEPKKILRSAFDFASPKIAAFSSAISLACRSDSNLRLLSIASISRLSRKKSSSTSLSRFPLAHISAFLNASPRNKKPSFISDPCQARNAEP